MLFFILLSSVNIFSSKNMKQKKDAPSATMLGKTGALLSRLQ